MTVPAPALPAAAVIESHLERLAGLLRGMSVEAVHRVFRRLQEARDAGATVYIVGNGGSAATGSHWVNDLSRAARRSGRAPLRVMNLSDNVPWLTALANDESYERVFAGQLESVARAGDVLVAISASGNSPNVVKAVELARERGLVTIGFLGFDGGALKNMVDEYVWIPTESGAYELVEDCHMALCHILAKCLAQDYASGGDAG